MAIKEKENSLWRFRFEVEGEKKPVEVVAPKKDGLVELGKALGVGSHWSRAYTLKCVHKLRPKLLTKEPFSGQRLLK